MNVRRCLFFAAGLCLFMLQEAPACPVCYGANDSPAAAGMNTAIVVMLGITGFVLSIISAFFLMMWRRYRRHREILSKQLFVNQEGVLQSENEKGVAEWNNF